MTLYTSPQPTPARPFKAPYEKRNITIPHPQHIKTKDTRVLGGFQFESYMDHIRGKTLLN